LKDEEIHDFPFIRLASRLDLMRDDHLPRTTPPALASVLDCWIDDHPGQESLVDVVRVITEVGARLATIVAVGPLEAAHAKGSPGSSTNASGDVQKPLDVQAEELFLVALAGCDVVAVCSEESEELIPLNAGGGLMVAIDPVDGSSNIDTNAPIGTIFSVLPATGFGDDPAAALLQSGRHQLAAGMIVFGPSTVLALTLGEGTDIYVLDPQSRAFLVARRHVELPADSNEYAINASNARHWGPGIREYVSDLVSGALGPRERDFNMRWLASLVAEAYRILTRGGIFLYPADARQGYQEGRIRLIYEANPIAFLCEQAGGAATDGVTAILDLQPSQPHQRVPFVFGSRSKVERVRRYLLEPQTSHQRSPLFSDRGLFRPKGPGRP
jgi:fructose-1,6-bisphosphatase I